MNTRLIAIALTVVFGLILQATVLAELNLFGLSLKPDLVLITAISYGLLKGPWYGAGLGLAAGLTADLFSGGVLGIGALSRMIAGFLAGLLEKAIFKDNLLVPALSLLAGTVVAEAIFLLVHSALAWHFGSILYLIPRLLAISILNALIAPLVYRQFYRLELRLAAV